MLSCQPTTHRFSYYIMDNNLMAWQRRIYALCDIWIGCVLMLSLSHTVCARVVPFEVLPKIIIFNSSFAMRSGPIQTDLCDYLRLLCFIAKIFETKTTNFGQVQSIYHNCPLFLTAVVSATQAKWIHIEHIIRGYAHVHTTNHKMPKKI